MTIRNTLLAASAAALAITASTEALAKPRYAATITRTTFGIPHIEARDWRGVGYGVAYAYAKDNLCLLAEEFATVAGERSRFWGPEGKAVLASAVPIWTATHAEVENLLPDGDPDRLRDDLRALS